MKRQIDRPKIVPRHNKIPGKPQWPAGDFLCNFHPVASLFFSPRFSPPEIPRARTNLPPLKNQDNARARNLLPVRFSRVFRAFFRRNLRNVQPCIFAPPL